jgi:very-short-patch-repair endonuclease
MNKKDIIDDIIANSNYKLREAYVANTIIYGDYIKYKESYNFSEYVFKEIFFHFVHNLEPIKCGVDGCGNKPKMEHFSKGFRKYCSNKCKSNAPEWKQKVKETNIKKFGVENPFQSDIIKNKIKESNITKYGVENPSQIKGVIEKANITKKAILKSKHPNIVDSSELYIQVICEVCDTISPIYKKTFFSRVANSYNVCTECNPINSMSSTKEKLLLTFIKENYTGKILTSDKTVLGGKELDIYLPDIKLAFEFNGLLWHSEFKVDKKYHIDKTNSCLEKGVHLIHIWEDDWTHKNEIVKSRILNLLKTNQRKLYARKCKIGVVDTSETKTFLKSNHIQGFVNSKISIGLYHDNELVSLMTFSNLRKNLNQTNKSGYFELTRFCSRLNYNVVGAAGKLLSYFIKNYVFCEIVSYADRSWSNGHVYDKLGFTFVHNTEPNYYYIERNKRFNRWNYRKDILVKQGFDSSKTEHQIMLDRKIYRIYDSGSKKYVLDNKKRSV